MTPALLPSLSSPSSQPLSPEGRPARIGVLALQGGVIEHLRLLAQLGADAVPVRRVEQLAHLDGLVLPGGESSTMDHLLREFGMAQPLRAAIAGGLPTLATCAGMVILATEIVDPAPGQQSLAVLPITVQRNAFGSQLVSEEAMVDTTVGQVRAAFIRAPIVTAVREGVEVIAHHRGRVVGVATRPAGGAPGAGQGPIASGNAATPGPCVVAVSFHPELTGDPTLHRWLLAAASGQAAAGPALAGATTTELRSGAPTY